MVLSYLRTVTKYYPFQQPRASLLKRLPDVPKEFGCFQAKNGIKYVAYPCGQDYIVKNLFWFGDFEPWITFMIRCLIKSGEVVCDIGANIGDTALQILPYLGSSGHIYCFEPVPVLQACLVENLKANNVSSISLVPKVLSNCCGQLIMTVPVTQPGWSKIINNNTDSVSENIEIEVITFDDWLKESNISQVAVCKVDVEGHELEVFEGMKNSLRAGKIGSIIFERHQQCNTTDAVVKFLYDFNYKIFRIYKSFLKTEALELLNHQTYLRKTADYIAVLEGSIFEQRLREHL